MLLRIASAVLISMCPAYAEDWPQFRGPDQQGHSAEVNLPVTWSETEHVAWKTALPGLGWSSPAIVGKQIWLTTATDDGHSLRALCVDRDSGALAHNIEIFHKDNPGSIHGKNSHASPTAMIDGNRVYVHYGRHGTACLTTAGEIVWQTILEYEHRHGPAGSPVVFENLVILNCDGTDRQFVVALDKHTGKEAWRQPRAAENQGRATMAYSTPLLTDVHGQPQLISVGGEWTVAYEPRTGHEAWRFRYPKGYSNVPRPVAAFGLTFVSSGYDTPAFYALKLSANAETDGPRVAWKMMKGAPRNASPLIVDSEIYLVNDNGITTCLDARTGAQHWQQRLNGDFSASPLFADGRIYLTDEIGKTTVIAPGKKFEGLAENQLPGRTLASLATADSALFLRTDTALYRLQKR